MPIEAGEYLRRSFVLLSHGCFVLEAELTILMVDHQDCFPKVPVLVENFGEGEQEMLQLVPDMLFFRLREDGFFLRIGAGGNPYMPMVARVGLMDGRIREPMKGFLENLRAHACLAPVAK